AGRAGFGPLEWGLFGMLASGGIAMAWFNPQLYGRLPWISMGVCAVMLGQWKPEQPESMGWTILLFALLHAVPGYYLMGRSPIPKTWGALTVTTVLIYYLLGYWLLRHTLPWDAVTPIWDVIPLFWGALALVLAGVSFHGMLQLHRHWRQRPDAEVMLALFMSSFTAFLSLALTIELEREFLSVAMAGQVLGLAWINRRIPLKAMRPIIAVMALGFAGLLMPQILLLVQLTAYSLVEAKLHLQQSLPIVQWPLFQLGVPAGLFLGASYLLYREQDGKLVRSLESAAVALVAIMGYYLSRKGFHADQNVLFIKAGFLERGFITNVLFLYGLICLMAGRYFERSAFSWSGFVLAMVALFRIAFFDLLLYNPILAHQQILGMTLFNTLLLPFGLPLIWGTLLGKELIQVQMASIRPYLGGFLLLLLFVLTSLNVRFFFHGEYLDTGHASNMEIYSYSAVWMALGIGLLVAGIWRVHKALRYASLVMLTVTVLKVFLYDAGELEGLYRVFSLMGLGLCMLGLSYVYTRFVLERK
ncbi:MAG: DUF2339 domain-containing protein, partial [Magnetococcales bacterium]|nr:DUF2339 domain-containing protein [Magnetococcales bacterium]